MSNPSGEDEREDEIEENTSDEVAETSKSKNEDAEEGGAEYESLFDGVEDVDSNREKADRMRQESEQAPDQPPAATALDELAEGESLSEVLAVTLKEWREMKQISRQRDEAEFEFQRRVITIGTIAIVVVVFVSGLLSYTGNLPGSSFAFILGTLFGSLGTILQSFIRKHQSEA